MPSAECPPPTNERSSQYAPGSPERAELKARLASMANERVEIPLIIGGKEIRTGKTQQSVMPFKHKHVLADYHMAEPKHVQMAVKAALAARREWSSWAFEDRAAVLLKAAELLATSQRATLNAATMLGQAKAVFQAEIDAACELTDFWRYQRQLRAGALSGAAEEHHRRLESAGVPAARGLRLRGVALQLHRDRRQPVDGAGADGRRVDLEAGVELRCSARTT